MNCLYGGGCSSTITRESVVRMTATSVPTIIGGVMVVVVLTVHVDVTRRTLSSSIVTAATVVVVVVVAVVAVVVVVAVVSVASVASVVFVVFVVSVVDMLLAE